MMTSEADFEGFRVEEVLSRSSTTSVYRAFQYSLKRTVLIKELRPELFREEDLRKRFEREARVYPHIKHENIVDIYEYSAEHGKIYLVMEFVDGCSLAELLQTYPKPQLDLAYAIVTQTLKGLAYAHSKGVVHRDLKPGNILISRDGWVKVTDFGLALFEGLPHITQPGAVVGTPAYLSPEVISGGSITPGSDIFSLGVTFYQLFAGERVFYAEHFSDSLSRVLSYHPPKPSQFRPEIPAQLDRIILRMLEKQPNKRWASCAEIIAELEKIDEGRHLENPKQPVRRYWQSPPDREPRPAEQLPAEPMKGGHRRSSAFIRVGLVAVLAVFIIYGVLSLTGDRSPPVHVTPIDSDRPHEIAGSDTIDQQLAAARDADTVDRIIFHPDVVTSTAPLKIHEEEPVQKTATSRGGTIQPAPSPPSKTDLIAAGDTSESALLADLGVVKGPARLRVRCDPWADVYVDNILVGKTPFEFIQLEPGEHRLVFRHPEFAPIFHDIVAQPGEELDLKIDLWETVGRIFILVDTWAEVYIDGDYIDVTPLKEPLIVPLGVHTVTLKNPAAAPWEKELKFNRGDPPCTLKVALKPADG